MLSMTVFEYLVTSLGWFLAGIGSTCLWKEAKRNASSRG